MTSDEKADIARILGLIRTDATDDAAKLDGQPFSGHTMGHNFGQVYAVVDALAHICEALLDAVPIDNDPTLLHDIDREENTDG